MAKDFKPLWRQIDPKLAEEWGKNPTKSPEWKKCGEFWIESLGSCEYGLLFRKPVVIAGDKTVWTADWENLMVSLDDQIESERTKDHLTKPRPKVDGVSVR